MRAFKLISFVVAIFGAEKFARAEDADAEMKAKYDDVDYENLPEPTMPHNPHGIDLETIVATGTLDGVNKPSTPEEEEALQALINFHSYTMASAEIDASFEGLMGELKMDDLQDMMAKIQEEMEAEFMVSQMAQMDLKMSDLKGVSDEKKDAIQKAMDKLEAAGQDLLDESYFS